MLGKECHKFGVIVRDGDGITIADNLVDNSGFGAIVYGGKVGFAGNTLSGPGRFGFYADAGDIVFYDNAVRGFTNGLLVKGTAGGIIRKNRISQNQNGIVLGRPGLMVVRNTISHNKGNGIVAQPLDKSPAREGRTIIRQNIVSSNGGNGIGVSSLAGMVVIRENLLENNSMGVNVMSARAEIVQNTIVLNEGKGLGISGQAEASVTKNIIANNSGGLHLTTPAKLKGGGNVIHANIVERGFQLIDANYSKMDWMPGAGGRDILVSVAPAPHLKAESDLNLDPGFVKLGKDYRLRPDSAIVKELGREALPGAFPVAGR